MLSVVERNPTTTPVGTVIWLHGLGADGHDFEPIVPELGLPAELPLRFVFPHAEPRPVTLNGGMQMRAWFDILGLDRQSAVDVAGIRTSCQAVEQLISAELERGVPAERILVAGFSQGGVIAMVTALSYPVPLAGLMALSTYLPGSSALDIERHPANSALPIFAAHGRDDLTLPLVLGEELRERLSAWGYPVDWHEYAMGHAVCAQEIADIAAFLTRVFTQDG